MPEVFQPFFKFLWIPNLFIPESSKGCALFTTSRKGGFPLRIAYAHGRRAFLMKWRHQEEWISLNTDTANGFELEAEVNLQETPTLLTILSGTNPSPRYICNFKMLIVHR